MESKSIYDVTKEGYTQYGSYVNNSRHIPLVFDGLKPSYRRTIYGALQLCGSSNKFIKSAQLSGFVIGNLHPHGDASVNGVIAELVQAGIFEGQGNFGGSTALGEKFEMAAVRYTEVRLDPKWHAIFSELLPYVEWEDSYIGVKMPSYLPTPIPLSFLFGSIGIGFGTGCLIPNFSAKSMVDAFKSDDPYKLCPAFNKIKFKYEKCDFENIWNTGYATMSYIPTVYRGSAPDCGDGIYIETDARFIVPDIPWIKEKASQDRLFLREETDESGEKLFMGKYPRIQEDMESYVKYILESCEVTEMYRLFVTDGKVTRLISLRNWISFTYHRYLGYIDTMKKSKIARIDKEIRVLSILPEIGDLISKNKNISEGEIRNNFPDVSAEDIKACLAKPIRKLMKSEHTGEIEGLKANRSKIEAINPELYTLDILNKM